MKTMSEKQAIAAIRDGQIVTAPYHVGRYGPGKLYHAWGEATLGRALGPEGYLKLGVSKEGSVIIDEWDDWCPTGMQGMKTGTQGGHYVES